MTETEIKNLKVGDTFIIKYTVTDRDCCMILASFDGETKMPFIPEVGSGARALRAATRYTTFEAGDTVRIVPDPLTGYVHVDCEGIGLNAIGRECVVTAVHRDTCKADVRLWINADVTKYSVSLHCLELVKKAAQNRYSVGSATGGMWQIFDNQQQRTIVSYGSGHPNAKSAAEAECERLNAEWRKQLEGDQK